jgi:integrase
VKYLQRPSADHKNLYYQRQWPRDLVSVAKAHGYGSIYRTNLDVKPDSPDVDKAIAKAAEDKKYEQLVGRLQSIPVVGTGLSVNLKTGQRKKTRVTTQPTTPPISSLLQLFHTKFKPESGKALRDRQKYWNEFLDHMPGDRFATNSAIHDIHQGFDLWQDAMLQRGCTSATVARGRNSVTAVLNWAMREYRLDWVLRLRQLPKQKAKTKKPLSYAEQERLVETLMADGDETAAMILFMLQGGQMPSEVARLDTKLLTETLAAEPPFVVIGNDDIQTKTSVRRRVVPVVLAVELIRAKLSAASERAAKAADSAATVNKRLKARGFEATGHAMRHTFKANCLAADVNPQLTASIAGWTGSVVNEIMLNYGSEGLSNSEIVRSLTDAQRKIHHHLLSSDVC